MAKTTATAKSTKTSLTVSITSDAPAQNNAQTANSKAAIKPISSLNEQQAKTANQKTLNTKALAPETNASLKEEAEKLTALKSIDASLKSLNKSFIDFTKSQKPGSIPVGGNQGKNNNIGDGITGAKNINSSDQPVLVELPKTFPTEIMQAYSDMILNNKSLKDEWKTWINEAIDMTELQKMAMEKLQGIEGAEPEKNEYDVNNNEKAFDPTDIINSLKEGQNAINENLKTFNESSKGNVSAKELQATESAMMDAFQKQAETNAASLNTKTPDESINKLNEEIKKLSDQNSKAVEQQAQTQKSLDTLAGAEADLNQSAKKETNGLYDEIADQLINGKSAEVNKELEKENEAINNVSENISEFKDKVSELEIEKINELTEKNLEILKKSERCCEICNHRKKRKNKRRKYSRN